VDIGIDIGIDITIPASKRTRVALTAAQLRTMVKAWLARPLIQDIEIVFWVAGTPHSIHASADVLRDAVAVG
jgi:hypothetical protein